jgi:hypothetical protein
MALEKWFVSSEEQLAFQFNLLNDLLKSQDIEVKVIAVSLCNLLLDRQANSVVKAKAHPGDLLATILDLLSAQYAISCLDTIHLCKVIRKTISWNKEAAD